MADSREPQQPIPLGPKGQPLPRLWKHEPDEDEPSTPGKGMSPDEKDKADGASPVEKQPKRKDAARSKKVEKDARAAGRTTVLREETPRLDTVETRQRIRILVGAGIFGLLSLGGLLIYQAFKPDPDEDEPVDLGAAVASAPAAPDHERSEKEARELLDRARQVAKNGNATMAVSFLERLGKNYPGTTAAAEAKEALGRPGRNLPLFLDRPTVEASEAPDAPRGQALAVVEATPTPPAPARGAVADLQPPANTPEPPAGIGASATSGAPTIASRPLPKGFAPRPGAEVHESGWAFEILGERDGAPMVLVSGGVFLRGRDGEDPAEAPEHKVRLSTFYVDQHEVTVRQFKIFQRELGRRQDRDRAIARDKGLAELDADDNAPVVMVTAREASDYATWAGKRLPTEAQWEASARTPDGRLFPWGSDPEPAKDRQIHPVLAFRKDRSPYGAFDLGGNAWEWTKDWFDSRAYQAFKYAPADHPTGPTTRPRSTQLVIKGTGNDWVVSRREGLKFDARLPYLGFRCVLPVEGPGNAFEPPPAPAERTPSGAPAASGGVVPF